MNDQKVIWTQEFSVGDDELDRDHKKLLQIFNKLTENGLSQKGEDFAAILSELTDYSLLHFKREEKYMQDLSYPKFEEHKVYHKDFIYKVAMFNVNYLGENSTDAQDVIKFLRKWWINHILYTDKDYNHFKEQMTS